MPIYEYICRDCGHALEQLQKLSDDPLTQCPACGQATLKRKVSAVGFRLSGGGWYETDFKSDRRRNVAGEQDKSDTSKADKAEKGGDDKTKSATGSDAKTDSAQKKPESGSQSSTPAKKDNSSARPSPSSE